jgi:hypothetical protein
MMMCNKTCSLFKDIAAIKYIASISFVILLLSGAYRDGNAAPADEAAALRQKFTAIKPRLEKNQFQRPLYLDSTEAESTMKGDIYAVMDYPFSEVRRALSDPEHAPPNWCDIMMLHPNTKYCRVAPGKKILKVRIGKKSEQPLEDAHPMQFNYRFEQGISDYFRVDLTAEKGPLGTRDYRVVINAVPLDDKRTFLHLAYACSANLAARAAMRVYLATIGRDKVGFTILGTFRDGKSSTSTAYAVWWSATLCVITSQSMRSFIPCPFLPKKGWKNGFSNGSAERNGMRVNYLNQDPMNICK